MNIIEAIKSGKRFRRISWNTNDWISQDCGHLHLKLKRNDIVADDWEIEQVAVTITREQFNKIWDVSIDKCTNLQSWNIIQLHGILVKELGL